MKSEALGWEINGENENGWIGRYIDVTATGVWRVENGCQASDFAPASSSCSSE